MGRQVAGGLGPARLTAAAVAVLATMLLVVALAASPARAATLTVNSTNDPGSGGCNASECTLREAIFFASSGDIITFADSLDGKTITLTDGQLDIDKGLIIEGPGADQLAVSGNDQSRVFEIASGNEVEIRKLTITGGGGNAVAGGINNYGNLRLTGSSVTGNSAGFGGGIYSHHYGTLTVVRSLISNNSSGYGGGGINNSGDLTLSNSTVSGNTTDEEGGGIRTSRAAKIENSTITQNTAPVGQGSGVAGVGDPVTTTEVSSSIIAGNTNSDVDFVSGDSNNFVSQGYNLIGTGNTTAAFDNTGDQVIGNKDPGLGSLADNGGPTLTHSLLFASPAIDKGDSSSPGDQRFRFRNRDLPKRVNASGGDGTDVGSLELQSDYDSRCTLIGSSLDETLRGTAGDDVICGLGGEDTLIGFSGADTLVGGPANDRLFGNSGADKVIGKAGDDAMTGGPGRDTLVGNSGADSIVGKTGRDKVLGNIGEDLVAGGPDTDLIAGGPDNDRLFGNGSFDRVIGQGGDDSMTGGAGDDTVLGKAGSDSFVGAAGEDVLRGGDGNDTIGGGDDDDRIFGDGGDDGLLGNAGDDILKGGPGSDRLNGGPGNDTEIQD